MKIFLFKKKRFFFAFEVYMRKCAIDTYYSGKWKCKVIKFIHISKEFYISNSFQMRAWLGKNIIKYGGRQSYM